MIRALLVDDEPHAQASLAALLAEPNTATTLEVVGVCSNGLEAVKAVQELRPQLLFLDIQMPKLDGFDVLELLGDDAPLTVFVTAYDEYALTAFEHNALDYLLKPVSAERLAKTLARVAERLAEHHPCVSPPASLWQARQQAHGPLTRILVRERGDVHVVPVAQVIALEAADDYVVIHTQARNYIKQERLNQFEALLDPQQFCRVHRSAIINLNFLHSIEQDGRDQRSAKLEHNRQFPISRSGYARLVESM